jgi:hypothetical protein
MKTALIATLFAFVAAAGLHAKDEKLPKIPEDKGELEGGGKRWSVFTIEDAKKEALKKKQPIAFVVTDERAEEAAVKLAGPVLFWGLQKECTMVVLPSTTAGQWKDRLPPAAYAGITDKTVSKEMPKAVVTDQTATTLIGKIQANQVIGEEGGKAVKEFTKLMKETNKDPKKVAEAAAASAAAAAAPAKPAAPAAAPATAPAPGAPAAPAATAATPPAPAAAPPAPAAGPVAIKGAQPEPWTSAQGTKIQATLLEVNGDSATLLMADGRKLPVPVASLSPESQKRIEELKAASAK